MVDCVRTDCTEGWAKKKAKVMLVQVLVSAGCAVGQALAG